MNNKRLQKIGRIGEEYIFKKIFKEAEWVNEKEEKGLYYDGKIGGIKVDVKTTTAKTYTFNCLWSNHNQYFDSETLFIFVYYDEINKTCIIDFMYKGKELNTYKQIHPSIKGKKNTCYIYRKD
mgnify:FL=1|tara:strand:- start:1695 stop:2063 length:369 start_codon:yes stop_codon:yes gene_type:complete